MKRSVFILSLCVLLITASRSYAQSTSIELFGTAIELPARPQAPDFKAALSEESIRSYLASIDASVYQPFLEQLLDYKQTYKPDDWLYYQAIRKMAQHLSPKADDYYRYTFFKWWLLMRSGYKSIVSYSHPYLLLYVQSDENVYNIPVRTHNNEQYICLNYHDYGNIDFPQYKFSVVTLTDNTLAFSYKVNSLPEFRQSDYTEKDVKFNDGMNQYNFRIKINPQVQSIFKNYPVVDYDLQFNMPLSKPTYESLIPSLKKHLAGMKQREGVEFLMRFTRYGFLFKPDMEVFGGEKRLTPEQTLLNEFSDCEDRAALFFFLVKEIYNLPMLVLTYPEHVTVAVQFKKPVDQTVEYNGMKYSLCEPSPQSIDLRAGQVMPQLRRQAYYIAYVYNPIAHK